MEKTRRMEAILQGDTTAKLPSNVKVVRIFTSSTFTDTKHERNALMTRVYPRLKDFCKSKGYEFQVVDMRWGVRDESTADHMTTALCMQELKACQELSTGPNFVTFLGQKYGYRPFPAKIFATEFENLLEGVSEAENKSLLNTWFYRDDNSVPPVYVLQPITVHLRHFNDNENHEARKTDRSKWWSQFEAMQVILRKAAAKQLEKQDAAKYFMSVTEDEIHNGILKASEPNKHCFWFRRNIKNLQEEASKSKNVSRFYIDILGDQLDEEAVKLLKQLKENGLEKTLDEEKILNYEVTWDKENGIDPGSCPEHEKYIENLCCDFEQKLIESIQNGIDARTLVELKDPLYEEVAQHISTCQEKCNLFYGRYQELARIKAYLGNADQTPLVVYGESGCGKTSLVAMAARQADQCSDNVRPVILMRYLGTTQQSSNIRAMLYSICQQICRIYDADRAGVPQDYNQLTKFFVQILGKASANKPLVVFLDSLDQLSEDYGARQLAWLPLRLPANVKLVVSTLPGEIYCCFPILRTSLENEKSFVLVPQLPTSQATDILQKWLTEGGRILTTRQNELVQQVFASCSLALFVKLTFDEVHRWTSYTSEDECVLQLTVREAINSVFQKLEYRHGKLLVSHALSYLTQSKHGVSDPEMEDLLSLDDDVLNDVYQYWTPPSRRLPPLLWIRIKAELGSYIVSRGADGIQVNTWYHRQFIETAHERYLTCEKHLKKISKSISEYFLGTWAGNVKPYLDTNGSSLKADRLVAKQPLFYTSMHSSEEKVYNLRKFSELPHSLITAGMLDNLKQNVLCNYQWLFTKLLATSFRDVIEDFNKASDVFPDDEELVLVREALQLSTTALAQDPSQLASQLVGRLLDKLKEPGNERMVYAKNLVYEQAHNPPHLALVPDKVCLTQPGGPVQHTITAHESFSDVYLTRDKKRIFSSSYDGTLKIFDARYGYMIRSTEGVKNMSKFFEVDASEEIGVTSGDSAIQVWKINTGQLLHTFPSSPNISPIALINDHIVTIAEGRLEVFNFHTGVKEKTFTDDKLQLEAHWHKSRIACQATGELVAYSRDKENTVNIWNYKTSEMIHVVTVHDLTSVDAITVSAAGVVYVAEYNGGPIVSFQLSSGEMMRRLVGGRRVQMTATLKTTPNNRFLIINMYQHVAVWDLVDDKELHHIYHPSPLNRVSLSTDGRILVTAGFDYLVRVWDLRQMSNKRPTSRTIDDFVAPSSLVEKPNTRYTVLQSFWHYVTVWDNTTGQKVKEIHPGIDQTTMIDDTRALISTEKQLKILDLPNGVVVRALQGNCSYDSGNERVLKPALLDKERVVVASRGRRHLKIMSLTSGDLLKTLKVNDTIGRIESLLVSRDGTTAVNLTDSNTAVVWDIPTTTYKLVSGLHKKGGFIHGQFSDISDDGRHLVNIDDTSGSKELARVYDLRNACVMYTLPVTEREIKCVAIATANKRVLTGTRKFCLSVWHLTSGHLLHHLGGFEYPIHSITVSGDGCRVITSSCVTGEQSMRLYDIVQGKLLAAFTPEESWTSAFHVNNKVVLCKPGFTGMVRFRLLSSQHNEEQMVDEHEEEIDWGETSVTINDVTSFKDDGDNDTDE